MPSVVHNASEGAKFRSDHSLRVVSCPTCFIVYAIPQSLDAAAHDWPGDTERGWKLCCPLGHTWWYAGKSIEEKRQKAEDNARWYRERMHAERDLRKDTERRLSAQKGATTKARKRAAAALCPCCNRSFVQLRRHLATKHPNYKPTG